MGRFLCVCHLSKREKSKLVKLLSKANLNTSQRQKSSSEILKDIYGNRAGVFNGFGLAEVTDKSNFDIKVFSLLKRNGNHYVQVFMIGLKEKEEMIL